MFEHYQKAGIHNRYDLTWIDKSEGEFQTQVSIWFNQISSGRYFGNTGAGKTNRKLLTQEFFNALLIYKDMITDLTGSVHSAAARDVENKINVYSRLYLARYSKKNTNDFLQRPRNRLPAYESFREKVNLNATKIRLIERKKQLVKYWITSVNDFNPHLDDVSLLFQYLGCAPESKVRLFLDVMCKDAQKIADMTDPKPYSVGIEFHAGGHAKSSVEWTDEEFKKAVKAEASAGYGVSLNGKAYPSEVKGLKAELTGEAWAGARAQAEGEAVLDNTGVSVKGKVSAELSIKISANAKIDCADIFAAELSCEAFVGAMASAEVEITANVDGVAVKLDAKAFIGAQISGSATKTFTLAGYEIFKAEAKGSLSFGIGAAFNFGIESSVFGGTKMELGASATVGVGGGVESKFTVKPDNLERALAAYYYMGYLHILGQQDKSRTWYKYFKDLEGNLQLFNKADAQMELYLKQIVMERVHLFNTSPQWKLLENLSIYKTTRQLPHVIALPTKPKRRRAISPETAPA